MNEKFSNEPIWDMIVGGISSLICYGAIIWCIFKLFTEENPNVPFYVVGIIVSTVMSFFSTILFVGSYRQEHGI